MTNVIEITKKRKGYKFAECGLDYVYLINGYKIDNDPDLGESVTIFNADKLHREIARTVLLYKEKLGDQEIRFFRSLLRLTQEQLSKKLGVVREEVVRWENKKNKLSETADGLLRIMIWEEYLDEDKAFSFFEKHRKDRIHYEMIEMTEARNKWKSQIAA